MPCAKLGLKPRPEVRAPIGNTATTALSSEWSAPHNPSAPQAQRCFVGCPLWYCVCPRHRWHEEGSIKTIIIQHNIVTQNKIYRNRVDICAPLTETLAERSSGAWKPSLSSALSPTRSPRSAYPMTLLVKLAVACTASWPSNTSSRHADT
eukprot:2921832-Pyramimonas_sp.AAC.2